MLAFEFLLFQCRLHLNSCGVAVHLKDVGMTSWFEKGFNKLTISAVTGICGLEDGEVIAFEGGNSVKCPTSRGFEYNPVLHPIKAVHGDRPGMSTTFLCFNDSLSDHLANVSNLCVEHPQ